MDVGGRVPCSNHVLDFIIKCSNDSQGPRHSRDFVYDMYTGSASFCQTEVEIHSRFTLGSASTSLSSIPFQPVYHLVTSSKFGLLLSHADKTCTAEREGRKEDSNGQCHAQTPHIVFAPTPRPHLMRKRGRRLIGSWYKVKKSQL